MYENCNVIVLFNICKMNSILLSILKNETRIMPKIRTKRHVNYLGEIDMVSCVQPIAFSPEISSCTYVKEYASCNHHTSFINYLKILVCTFDFNPQEGGGLVVAIAFTSFFIALYIMLLYILVKHFLVPNSLAFMTASRLSEHTYGYIVLAFIIVVPDFINIGYRCSIRKQNSSVIFAASVGNNLSGFSCGMALLAFNFHKNRLNPKYYIVQMALFTLSICYQLILFDISEDAVHSGKHLEDSNLRIHGLLSLLVYLGIVAAFIAQQFWNRRMLSQDEKGTSMMQLSTIYSTTTITSDNVEVRSLYAHLHALNPFHHLQNFSTMLIIIMTPFWMLLSLTIPVFDKKRPLRGWLELTACVAFLAIPFFVVIILDPNLLLFRVLQVIGVVVCIFTLLLTRPSKIPRYFKFYAFIGLNVSLLYFLAIDYELKNLFWQLLNYIDVWKDDAIHIVYFSFGHTMLEYLMAWSYLHQGHEQAAYGLVMGVSIADAFLTLPFLSFSPCYDPDEIILITAHATTAAVFLFIIYTFLSIAVSFTDFYLRPSIGILPIIMYTIFCLVVSLSEIMVLHPIGSYHSVVLAPQVNQVWWA